MVIAGVVVVQPQHFRAVAESAKGRLRGLGGLCSLKKKEQDLEEEISADVYDGFSHNVCVVCVNGWKVRSERFIAFFTCLDGDESPTTNSGYCLCGSPGDQLPGHVTTPDQSGYTCQ